MKCIVAKIYTNTKHVEMYFNLCLHYTCFAERKTATFVFERQDNEASEIYNNLNLGNFKDKCFSLCICPLRRCSSSSFKNAKINELIDCFRETRSCGIGSTLYLSIYWQDFYHM